MVVKTNECSVRGKAIFLLASNNRSTWTSRSSGPLLRERLLEARAVRLLKQQDRPERLILVNLWGLRCVRVSAKLQDEGKNMAPWGWGGWYCISMLGLDRSNSSAAGFVDSRSDYSPIHTAGCQMESYNHLQCVTVILVLSKSTSVSLWFYCHAKQQSHSEPNFFIRYTMLGIATGFIP